MSWIIKIENLSKMYKLGTINSGTLQDDLKRIWYKWRGFENPFLKIGETNKRDESGGDYVWALKDINFEVKTGEVMGIIGKNGAGKSTLLKLLSKVTRPTTGSIKTKGRIASLLEVGTGFHPELTGKENIFLNGAILGMTKSEITAKLDEIIDFSGCEKYIDTPVKRYSSGMYVRLAFAVAAHLDPEILIVDEVLAVGDAEFQKKAIGKMKDVSAKDGRTVLFVSHNMNSIQKLCTSATLLENGMVKFQGSPKATIQKYLSKTITDGEKKDFNLIKRREGHGEIVRIIDIDLLNSKNNSTTSLMFSEPFKIRVTIKGLKELKNVDLSIRIDSEDEIPISSIVKSDSSSNVDFRNNEIKEFIVSLNDFHLTPKTYALIVTVKSGRMAYDRLENEFYFEVSNLTFEDNKPYNELWGQVQIYPKWTIKKR